MRLLITGVCGFVGSRVARAFRLSHPEWSIVGLDNFSRPGSRLHLPILSRLGVEVLEADLRDRGLASRLPPCDWVIDCAANPSVLAGLSRESSSMEVMDHNLIGTIHLLEYCKAFRTGLVLVSTSRVYSAERLSRLPVVVAGNAYRPDRNLLQEARSWDSPWFGLSDRGIDERFSTQPPLSLYGASKLASELVAAEYASAFGFPLFINRCGVMAGAGQFGRTDQGIVAYWIHSWFEGQSLRYIGFDGMGHQVRDCLHPDDLARLVAQQVLAGRDFEGPRLCNVSGGSESSFSLLELSAWCERRWPGRRSSTTSIEPDFRSRPYDSPWIVLDSGVAERTWGWRPGWTKETIWSEIAGHAESDPEWLARCR